MSEPNLQRTLSAHALAQLVAKMDSKGRPIVALTLCIPVCYVVALEALHRLRDRHDRIAAIEDVEILFSLLHTRFLLARVMVLVKSKRSRSFLP
jgi:hypothetical protein